VPETVPQSVAASIPRLVVTNTLASKIIDEERKQKLIRLASHWIALAGDRQKLLEQKAKQ
jgi:hypothetical protein